MSLPEKVLWSEPPERDSLSDSLRRVRVFRRAVIGLRWGVIGGLLTSGFLAATHLPSRVSGFMLWLCLVIPGLFGGWRWFRQRRTKLQTEPKDEALLESQFPSLRNDVTTIREWLSAGRASRFLYSPVLLHALEVDLTERLKGLPWSEAFGWIGFLRSQRRMLFLLPFLFVSSWALFDAGRIQATLLGAFGKIESSALTPSSTKPFYAASLFADYRFPRYTGRSELRNQEVSGTVEGFPGTEVRLRFVTDRPMRRVGLKLPKGFYQPADGTDGRNFKATFTIRESGDLVFQGTDEAGENLEDPLVRTIQATADEPPSVKLLSPQGEVKSSRDDVVSFRYQAQDDFGLSSAKLLFSGAGFRREVAVVPLTGRDRTERTRIPVSQLRVPPDLREVEVRAVAFDNDEVRGPKEGRSEVVIIRFPDPEKSRMDRMAALERWRDRFLLFLADHLEELSTVPTPRSKEWTDRYDGSYAPLRAIPDEVSTFRAGVGKLKKEFRGVLDDLTQGVSGLLQRQEEWTTQGAASIDFPKKHEADVADAERLTLLLDRVLTQDRLGRLTDSSEKLGNLVNRLSENPESLTTDRMREALRDLRSALRDVMKNLSDLSTQGAPEFVNREALKDLGLSSLEAQLNEIEKLLAEGKEAAAKAKMKSLLEEMKRLTEQARSKSSGMAKDIDRKLQEKLRSMAEETRKLTEEQRKLLDETSAKRGKPKTPEGMNEAQFKKELLRLIQELRVTLLETARESARETRVDWSRLAQEAVRESVKDADRLRTTVETGRLADSLGIAERIVDRLKAVVSRGRAMRGVFERAIPPGLGGGMLKGFPQTLQSLGQAEVIRDLLKGEDGTEQVSPRQSDQETDALADRQKQLRKKLDGLQDAVEELSKQLPLGPLRADQRLNEAGKAMESAEQGLRGGDVGGGIEHQRDAVAALERLEQSMESMNSEGGGENLEGMQGETATSEPMLLPEAEAKKEQEAWRKALMDALRQTPPKGYEDSTRKYLEELLR